MILTPHMLVGAAIGSKIENYWAIFILATALHFIFDMLPHWEYGRRYEIETITRRGLFLFFLQALIDLFAGLAIIVWVLWPEPFNYYVLFGALVSILPDGLVLLYAVWAVASKKKDNWLKKYYDFHKFFHIPDAKNKFLVGLLAEGFILLVALLVFLS